MSRREASHLTAYEAIIARFIAWASTESAIEAAMVIGSRARVDHPADAWSDLDIVVFTTNPGRLLGESEWLTAIGPPVITYIEPTAIGSWQERRVLFEGALDVDFAAVPAGLIATLEGLSPGDALYEELASVIRRGFRILIDRHARLASLLPAMSAPANSVPTRPHQDELTETLNNFWYQCVWMAKKLRRGEITVAHECLVGHQRWLLMRMVRWHAERDGAVWHRARFIEEWAHPYVVDQMAATWALHDAADIQRALTSMMDLMAWLSEEIATAYALVVPDASERAARQWVLEIAPS
jgi:aminoglycoside 6-adenylyltransferase